MKLYLGFVAILLSACGVPENSANLHIINGKPFRPNMPGANSMIAIMDRNGDILCTGVVLNSDHFLTAAHCGMLGQMKDAEIRSGLDVKRSAALTKVSSWVNHEGFNSAGLTQSKPTQLTADLMIVRTLTAMSGVGALSILEENADIALGSTLRTAGYGRSIGSDRSSASKALYGDFSVESINAAGGEMTLKDTTTGMACHGDSGGPVFVNISGDLVIAGIVSRGKRECDTNTSIVTDLRVFRDWIAEHEND
jgi:secreted trypsin-like serine protease